MSRRSRRRSSSSRREEDDDEEEEKEEQEEEGGGARPVLAVRNARVYSRSRAGWAHPRAERNSAGR